ncbi:MAG: FtsB family cell division protein [Limisphaerales bacterium]
MNVWDNLTRVMLFLIFGAFLMLVVVWYAPVIKQNERMRKEKLELDRKIAAETEVSKRLDAQTKALQDPRTVERLARERLSYAKPGEIVIHFEQPLTNSTESSLR